MYTIWFKAQWYTGERVGQVGDLEVVESEPLKVEANTLEVAQMLWDDLEETGYTMISARP